MIEPIRKTITVGCSPAVAFDLFTRDIAAWWPLERNSVSAMSGGTARSLVLEPRVGGTLYEITADGTREDWARVIVFDHGAMVRLSWHVLTTPNEASDVTIRFTAVPGGAQVDLIHAGWEALGSDAAARRDSYDGGWVHVFESAFARACAAQPAHSAAPSP